MKDLDPKSGCVCKSVIMECNYFKPFFYMTSLTWVVFSNHNNNQQQENSNHIIDKWRISSGISVLLTELAACTNVQEGQAAAVQCYQNCM